MQEHTTEYIEAPQEHEHRFASFAKTYNYTKLCNDLEFAQRCLERHTLDLYRLIEVVPDDQQTDPRLIHALRLLYCATDRVYNARHTLLPVAADHGPLPDQF